ncbi:Glycosyl transferase family 2 [Dethiosulfatibacter aminovorans DSM 17477]|uniref:Glycosyl transferase family 2 n=1 Tax=Dethiosulfatibacter aminovorans DSM 17477 TaxID=1121476 RepID=A0A1M6LNH9_9FIRM|nr:glycosyltransferase [Dethiosulfatibacter aminovorans]SHJ72769.1 Glycosyl transferase family 2 [Dethiosulfatibacter aminovorans DSM 17477]
MEYAPIAVFVYDRLKHFMNCIEALKRNKEARDSILYVFSDLYSCEDHREAVEAVREYAGKIDGFKEVRLIFRDKNHGAFLSINKGKDMVVKKHGVLICMEDDIVVSDRFLEFMNKALETYKDRKDVFSISAYSKRPAPETYGKDALLKPSLCPWGMATWLDRWEEAERHIFNPVSREDMKNRALLKQVRSINRNMLSGMREDMDGRIKVFDARMSLYMLKNDLYSVFPRKTLTVNTGYDGSGLHMDTREYYSKQELWVKEGEFEFDHDLEKDDIVMNQYLNTSNGGYKAFLKDILYRTGMLYPILDLDRWRKQRKLNRYNYRI